MNRQELSHYVHAQVKSLFSVDIDVSPYIDEAVERTAHCFSYSASKYFQEHAGEILVFNSVQYSVFLYFLSNTAYRHDKHGALAEKIFYLNKVLHSVELFYEVEMPSVFNVEHPLGSVMGRAKYADQFFFYQGCTVGGSGGYYPEIGFNVLMYSNSKLLGRSKVGDNVIFSANSYVINADIPSNCIVFGQSPNIIIKKKQPDEIKKMTAHIWRHEND